MYQKETVNNLTLVYFSLSQQKYGKSPGELAQIFQSMKKSLKDLVDKVTVVRLHGFKYCSLAVTLVLFMKSYYVLRYILINIYDC